MSKPLSKPLSKQRTLLFLTTIITLLSAVHIAQAAGIAMIPAATDLAPGSMSYGNVAKTGGLDPNIVAAIIGVTGVLIGSFLTIVGTYFLRFLDVRREDKREEVFMVRERKEKEYQIKQEIYKNFLTDLGAVEAFLVHKAENTEIKNVDSFNAEWTKMEIKMNLVCNNNIRELLDELQDQLMDLAKIRFADGKAELDKNYIEKRGQLMDAIREDIDLFQTH